jgi:hypothetical protein
MVVCHWLCFAFSLAAATCLAIVLACGNGWFLIGTCCGASGWIVTWVLYMVFFYIGTSVVKPMTTRRFLQMNTSLRVPTALERWWEVDGSFKVGNNTWHCYGGYNLGASGTDATIFPEISDRWANSFLFGGATAEINLVPAHAQLSTGIRERLEFCLPRQWSVGWSGTRTIRWDNPEVSDDVAVAMPELALVTPNGKVPYSIGKANRGAAGFFAAGLGYLYATYAQSPRFFVEVVKNNAILVNPPDYIPCTAFQFSCW